MHDPFTQDWADAYRAAIESDDAYRTAGAGWKWPLALVLDAAPDAGIPDARAVELTLDAGRCHAARALAPAQTNATFVLRGPYPTWKSIVRGELDPVTAVATGRLELAKGSLMSLMLQTGAARALVACARQVPTRFPDEG